MSNDAEIAKKFWKALKSDRTFMLGLAEDVRLHSQPMTAVLDGDEGPIWIFTSKETDLARRLGGGADAVAQFASKGHDVFATLEGRLTPDNDPQMIERLWNPFIAAWFEGGKTDPKLLLLRFDAGAAQIWLNENSLFAGVKVLLGGDPKETYKDKVAEVRLS